MNTISDIISRNWRRKAFDFNNNELINKLKIELFDYVKDAFFDPKNNVPVLDEQDKKNLAELFFWLIGNCHPLKYNKAPLITGDFGKGKSVTLKGLLEFINVHYSHDSVIGGITNPIYVLSQDMSNAFKDNNIEMINRMKTCSILGIDDLGYEPTEVQHFANVAKPFEEIIMKRYDKRKTTLITTNMTMDDLGKKYGWHIYDRVKQMSFLVEFKGESKRI